MVRLPSLNMVFVTLSLPVRSNYRIMKYSKKKKKRVRDVSEQNECISLRNEKKNKHEKNKY